MRSTEDVTRQLNDLVLCAAAGFAVVVAGASARGPEDISGRTGTAGPVEVSGRTGPAGASGRTGAEPERVKGGAAGGRSGSRLVVVDDDEQTSGQSGRSCWPFRELPDLRSIFWGW